MLPKKIKLKKEDHIALKELERDQLSHQQFIDQMIEAGKRKFSQFRDKHEKIWAKISRDYNIDVKTVFYEYSSQTGEIIPRQIMLKEDQK